MFTTSSLHRLKRIAAASFALSFGACGDDDTHEHGHDAATDAAGKDAATPDAGKTQRVEITFEGRVGSEAFDCNKTYEVGTPATLVKPLDFKLYVHDVRLLSASGSETSVTLEQDGVWQKDNVALLDFENDSGYCSNGTSQVNTKIIGSVPSGSYKGIRFDIGVPEALNHKNQATADSPLNIEGMFWSWLGGYKFLRIDVTPAHAMQADAEDAGPEHSGPVMGFLVHLGSTMCSGDPMTDEGVECQRTNRASASFTSFDASKQKVVVDVAKLLAKSDVSKNGGGEPGCMSGPMDPDCNAIFEQLGIEFGTGASVGTPAFLTVVGK